MSTTICSQFKKLVNSSAANFRVNLEELLKEFNHEVLLCEKTDAAKCFSDILHAGCFSPGKPPRWSGKRGDARKVYCTAEILYGFTISKHATESDCTSHLAGWKALSKDARGWCWNILTCEVSDGLSNSILNDLLKAKGIVTKIMREGGFIPDFTVAVSSQRDPLCRANPQDTLLTAVDD